MSQFKFAPQADISATIRSARMSIQRTRYAQTAYTNFSISSKYNINPGQKQKIVSINDELLTGRKLNHLQTQANKRFKALKRIQEQNDRLLKRINSQKSVYSQSTLKRSSASIRSISRCSSKEGSRRDLSQIKKNKIQNRKRMEPKISIEERKLQKIQGQQLQELKRVFFGAKKRNTQRNNENNKKMFHTSFNIRKQSRSSRTMETHRMGNMLHKIAEQFYQPLDQKQKKSKNRIIK